MQSPNRVPREVLAFYYRGRGNPAVSGKWLRWQGPNREAPDQDPVPAMPLLGMYDSLDPKVLAQHAIWLKQAGFTCVIHGAWYRELWEEHGGGQQFLKAMQAQGLKISFYIEGQKAGVEGAKADFRYLFAQAMSSPAWLRVRGRPVVFFYRRAFRDLPAQQWREAAKAVAAEGHPEPLLIGEVDPNDPEFVEKARWLDGTHLWSVAEFIAGMAPEQTQAFAMKAYPEWKARNPEGIHCATVMPGWNDLLLTTRPYPRPTTDRYGTGTLAALWRAAIANDADFVMVNSFNAWHNGNEIEPSRQWGDLALKANAEFARQFLRARR